MANWRIELASDVPPSRQIVEAVLDLLAAGGLAAGDRLPSVRGMAAEALVNHNTAARAYRDLEQLLVVEGQNGRGVFVTQAGPRIAAQLRRARTLVAFKRSLEEALRAGHSLVDLLAIVDSQRKRTA